MRVSAQCLERLAERRPNSFVVRDEGRWLPVVRVGEPLLPSWDPQNRTVDFPGGWFVEDSSFDVRLRVDG